MKFIFPFFFLFWLSPGRVKADVARDFSNANAAYLKGNYNAAVNLYEKIATAMAADVTLYYNLGTAYLKLNQTGKAVLNLERAAALSPNDGAIRHNLQAAHARIVEPIEDISPFFLHKWLLASSSIFSSSVWAILGISAIWVAVILQLVFWFKSEVLPPLAKWWLTPVFAAIGVVFLLISAAKFRFEHPENQAVVMDQQVSLRGAPEPAAEVILEVFEGTKVEILDRLHDWQKVELPNGDTGWLAASAIERI